MSRVGLAAIVVLAGSGAAIGVAWLLVPRDDVAPATVGDAVASFRVEREALAGEPSVVSEGVYVYATDRFEKTDALMAVPHHYPRRSTITLVRTDCGLRMRWDVLRGRSTEWVLCLEDGGWALVTQDERHTFFGRTEPTTYACRDALLRPLGDRAGRRSRVSCTTGSVEERGTGLVVGRALTRVGARAVPSVHVRKTTTFTGDIRGRSAYDFWLARATGVPVRIVMVTTTTNDSAVGDVRYEERVALVLRSSRPSR